MKSIAVKNALPILEMKYLHLSNIMTETQYQCSRLSQSLAQSIATADAQINLSFHSFVLIQIVGSGTGEAEGKKQFLAQIEPSRSNLSWICSKVGTANVDEWRCRVRP